MNEWNRKKKQQQKLNEYRNLERMEGDLRI